MLNNSGAWQQTMRDLEVIRHKRDIADFIRTPLQEIPATLEALRSTLRPLCRAIPELTNYDLSTEDGRREFPRTTSAILNLGIMLRTGDAIEKLQLSKAGSSEFERATAQLQSEYASFSVQQPAEGRITIDQFQALARLFEPIRKDPAAIQAVTLALVYGDIFKLKNVTEILKQRLPNSDHADHDLALQQAFAPQNIGKFKDLFPSIQELPAAYQQRVLSEIRGGVNLGHVLQMENCAGSLSDLHKLAQQDPEGLRYWLLPTLMDISAARADANKPQSWLGSSLMNRSLCAGLLDVAAALPTLKQQGPVAFFNQVHESIKKRPYYDALRADRSLQPTERETIYRLSRFFSFETDNRALPELIRSWKGLTEGDRKALLKFFGNTGLNADSPKTIVSYLPYVFTQLYAPKFPLPEAINGSIKMMLRVLLATENFDWKGNPAIRQVAGQNVWFGRLKNLTADQLFPGPTFEVARTGRTPELLVKSTLARRKQ